MKVVDACDVRLINADLVAEVRTKLPAASAIAEVASIFSLLADESRVRLISGLLEAGELCVCDLAAAADMSESATSHALRLLRGARVVKVRRSGRMAYYSLLDDHVRILLEVALTHVSHGVTDA